MQSKTLVYSLVTVYEATDVMYLIALQTSVNLFELNKEFSNLHMY